MSNNKVTCFVTNKKISKENAVAGDCIRKEVLDLIHQDHPEFNNKCHIAVNTLNSYRKQHLKNLVMKETEEVDTIQKEVLDAIASSSILSETIEADVAQELTFGQRMADMVAKFGGSWTFLTLFFSFIIAWMLINIHLYTSKPFDPYPFILLNLVLSCLAAVQAPIIMMSQNRTNEIDRIRDEHDYRINLKAELEIKLIMEKVDHMVSTQNKRLLDIQQLQNDYLEDILEHLINHKQSK